MRYKLLVQRGFTLVEMIIVLAMIGVLAAIAIPSFAEQIAQGRVTSTANQLHSTFKFARSEAAKRVEQVKLVASGDTWTVIRVDGDTLVEETLNVFKPSHDAVVITGLKTLTISTTGSPSSAEQFKVEGEDSSNGTYYLCVYLSGQSKLSKGAVCS